MREVRQAKSTTKTIYTYVPDKKIQKQFCVLFTEETTSRQMNWSKVQEKVTRDPWTVGLNKIKKEAGKNSNILIIPQMIIGLLFTYYPLPTTTTSFLIFFSEKNRKLFFMLQLHFKLHFFVKCYLFIHPLSIHFATAIPLQGFYVGCVGKVGIELDISFLPVPLPLAATTSSERNRIFCKKN